MKCLCINIDSDTESWRLSQQQFKRVGLEVERFPAIVEDNRVLAFNKSVYRAMKESNGDSLLLFEDDVIFDIDSRIDYYLSTNYLPEMPTNFLTLHLGANIIGTSSTIWKMPTYYSAHLAKLHNCWQSHATLYSADSVKYILDNFKFVTDEYKTEGCQIFDEWLRVNVLNQGRSYLLNPMIAYQRPRKSEIWNCMTDYIGAHKQGNEWLKNNL